MMAYNNIELASSETMMQFSHGMDAWPTHCWPVASEMQDLDMLQSLRPYWPG